MSDLGDWLDTQGLGQYSRVLEDNDVDFELLAELTDADLEKLGVSLGHRRKLLRAIAARPSPASPVAAPAAADARPIGPDGRDAERRQVTVMFCDLVGSTELANVLDPEDMGLLMRRFQDACACATTRFDGFIAKFMGDGLLAYFGYPQASEDAAEHAVRAAQGILEVLDTVERPDGRKLQARIGIATGMVVIGDIVGTGTAREHSVVGEPPNLAARLQALADPDSILISHNTYRMLGRRFEYQNLGECALKGFSAPVRVWRVLREAAVESRFAASRTTTDGAFVGRDEEMSLLLDRWEKVSSGSGHAIVISGEPGVGKSRLVDTLFDRIGAARRNHVTCQCSPYHTNSALYPVIRHLERAAGFAAGNPDSVKLEKLEAMLGGVIDARTRRETSLIADLLSLPTAGYAALDLSPAQRKAATLVALVDVLKRLAADAPVVLLLEDAHWIDPTTKELWTRLIDDMASASILALVTARPEFTSPWKNRDHVAALELTRLARADCALLIGDIAAPHALAADLIDEIIVKADGMPLFVEELTKGVLEALLDRPAVPASLQDSLMARLDRLGPAKEIAQIAAVIGPQFSKALLAAVATCPADELTNGIERLIDAGLAFRSSRTNDISYTFKHALLRDVAYENLLRSRRQQLHAKVAQALLANLPGVAESEPELLAHHYAHAGQYDLACTYRERAGDHAAARSSYIESVAHYAAALADASKLATGPERARRELDLLLKLGPAVIILKGPQSTDVAELYQRALGQAGALGDDKALFQATWGLWMNAMIARRLDRARDYADELVTLARKSRNDDLSLEGIHCRWSTALFRGDIATALTNGLEGIERYDRDKHRWLGPVFGGHDPGVCAYVVSAMALSQSGRFAEAKRRVEQGIALAEELKHPSTLSHALMNGLVSAQIRDDLPAVADCAERIIELADRYNLPPPRAQALFVAAWQRACVTDLHRGLAEMEAEYSRVTAIGPLFRYYAALLAEVMAKAGRFGDALAVLQTALETVTEPGVGLYVSELYRHQGLCLWAAGASKEREAMQSLRTAVSVAERQGATLLRLRAAMSLAGVAAETGRGADGAEPLRAACASVPPGFDAAILTEAQQLLSV